MFSLQRLLVKDEKFFELMSASAKEAQASLRELTGLVKSGATSHTLADFAQLRREDKRITQELTEHLCSTFVTPLEREDIELLSHALYKIPKSVEKFAERYLLAPQHVKGWDLTQMAAMLEKAGEALVVMVEGLRTEMNTSAMQVQNQALQQIEGEADKLMTQALQALYASGNDSVQLVVLKDLYELLERVFDRCRDVGNVVFRIVLKHS